MEALIAPPMRGEVFLNPGDLYFHNPAASRAQPAKLRTLLGSCVSIVLWQPQSRLGGMSHIILPGRSRPAAAAELEGRYANEVVMLFRREIIRAGALPPQFQAYIVGGSEMYATEQAVFSVGARNIEAARSHLKQAGFRVMAEHVGKGHHRKVELDLVTGVVTVICASQRINLTTGQFVSAAI